MHWMILPLRRYADFRGRARRREYWSFWLFLVLLFAVTVWIDSSFGLGGRTVTTIETGPALRASATQRQAGWVTAAASIAIVVPLLAVAVRRLHDIGRSGFWLLLWLVPAIGVIALLVMMLTDSQRGANRYGPDPRPVAVPAALG